MSKTLGQARALARGYYPVNDAGACRIIEEGEVFDLREGHTKGKWFEVIEPEAPPAKPAGKPAGKKKDEPLA